MGLPEISARLRAAEAAAGRLPGSVQLIAISKLQPEARVRAALVAGHRLFGENWVQEAAEKWPGLRAAFPGVQVHLVGPLQTNKARAAMGLFEAIHSLDRPKLAGALARLAQDLGHCPALFVQVNSGSEPQKAGVLPGEADAFIAEARRLDLPVAGLMCIPPVDDPPAPHFALLRKFARRNGLAGLSMGMSSDYETAAEMGATHVRVGSAIFGARG